MAKPEPQGIPEEAKSHPLSQSHNLSFSKLQPDPVHGFGVSGELFERKGPFSQESQKQTHRPPQRILKQTSLLCHQLRGCSVKPHLKKEEKLSVRNSFLSTWLPPCCLGFTAASRVFCVGIGFGNRSASWEPVFEPRVIPLLRT